MNAEPDWLEYLSGGVPTGEYFRKTLDDLRKALVPPQKDQLPIVNLPDLCFIDLISDFEAFCKDHFACLVNLEPSLTVNLKRRGSRCFHRFNSRCSLWINVGLSIGVFTCREIRLWDAEENQCSFENHASWQGRWEALRRLAARSESTCASWRVYTLAYVEQDASPNAVTDAFFQSKKLSAHEVANAIDFLEALAKKLLRSSRRALTKEIDERGISYSGERKKALEGITVSPGVMLGTIPVTVGGPHRSANRAI